MSTDFLSYWFALDALAMPKPSGVNTFEKQLARIYGLDQSDVTKRLLLGRFKDVRDRIAHEALRPPILGATFLAVIGPSAQRLDASGGRLYLSGLDESLTVKWEGNGLPERIGAVTLYRATPQIGESTHAAFLDATSRMVRPAGDG